FFFWSRKKSFNTKGLGGMILFLTNDLLGGVVVRKQKSLPRPPIFSKFQIFFKNFPALPLGKIASNFKTMREFHSLKLPRASSDRNIRALRLLFRSVIGFHNLTANIFTAKPRYAQGLFRYDNACFDDYADN
ncbi:hypothetical protein, partial [Lactococcus lactis]|uniref:hypothetical protein n=1 Tax=Lactococcus lactis TaxID=1358 RepID=UPI0013D8131C